MSTPLTVDATFTVLGGVAKLTDRHKPERSFEVDLCSLGDVPSLPEGLREPNEKWGGMRLVDLFSMLPPEWLREATMHIEIVTKFPQSSEAMDEQFNSITRILTGGA